MLFDVAVALVSGLVFAGWANHLVRPLLAGPAFRRTNYRGVELVVGSGLVLVVALLVSAAVGTVVRAGAPMPPSRVVVSVASWSAAIVPVVGFAFLGLLDDLGATGDTRGFRGHVRSAVRGELSTGAFKLFGGAALSLWWVAASHSYVHGFGSAWMFLDAALVALTANVANLFDRAPGRTLKLSALCFVVILLALSQRGWRTELSYLPFVLGALFVLLPGDLSERSMLGDTGSNVLGAIAGFALLELGRPVRAAMFLLVVFLNAAGERVSFSRIIDRNRPLRWLDRLGTLAERKGA